MPPPPPPPEPMEEEEVEVEVEEEVEEEVEVEVEEEVTTAPASPVPHQGAPDDHDIKRTFAPDQDTEPEPTNKRSKAVEPLEVAVVPLATAVAEPVDDVPDIYDFRTNLTPGVYSYVIESWTDKDKKIVTSLKMVRPAPNPKNYAQYFKTPPVALSYPVLHDLGNFKDGSKFEAKELGLAKFSFTFIEGELEKDPMFIKHVRAETGNATGPVETLEPIKDVKDFFDAVQAASDDFREHIWQNRDKVATEFIDVSIEKERTRAARIKGYLNAKGEGDASKIPADDPEVLAEAKIDFMTRCMGAIKIDEKTKCRKISASAKVFTMLDMNSKAGKTYAPIVGAKSAIEDAWNSRLVYNPIPIVDGEKAILSVDTYVPRDNPQAAKLVPKKFLHGDIASAVLAFKFIMSKPYTGIQVVLTNRPIQYIARGSRPRGTQGYKPNKYAMPYVDVSPEQLAEEARMQQQIRDKRSDISAQGP